jgi:hypothetical protein
MMNHLQPNESRRCGTLAATNRRQGWRPRLVPILSALTACLFALPACGDRESEWRAGLGSPDPVAVRGTVVLRDDPMQRLLFLTSPAERQLSVEAVRVGVNVSAVVPSVDGQDLFVLSKGVFPRFRESDEGPRLTLYDGAPRPLAEGRLKKRFELDDPMEHLALDPKGEWAAAFGGDASVVNPNELVLFDLTAGGRTGNQPASKTIRSFGGAPKELLFTDRLAVPEGPPRRFLVVLTDRDLALVDLADLAAPEKTIKLPQGPAGGASNPVQVVYDDGDPDDPGDARLAVRLERGSDVVFVQLGEPATPGSAFSVVFNIVDVGGVPSFLDFVRTDGGLRLAALVPALSRAVLVDPTTTLAETVSLPHGFSRMRRVTSELGEVSDAADVALLWGATQHVAFLSLGTTSATPYRSVDTAELSFPIERVLDVPAPHAHLKVLIGSSSDVFVLDLQSRQSLPLHTTFQSGQVRAAPDGQRLWIYERSGNLFSSVRLDDLHPQALYAEPTLSEVFDIERGDGGRSVVVLHLDGGWSATVMDAELPETAKTAYFPALQLAGLK